MHTEQEKRAASKLYALLYNGANIYNSKNRTKRGEALVDPVYRFCEIVRELNQYMKEHDNG